MKMEAVHAELKAWGELLITTDAGQGYEIHLGDTQWDFDHRMIRLKTAHSDIVIAGDTVASIEKHYGHPIGGDGH
jgi:hypothetical protein